MQSEIGGIPFIGEGGYYPHWARRSGRWLFQRTPIVIGQTGADMARFHAVEVPVSDQFVVWAPPTRLPRILGALPSAIHRERQQALDGCPASDWFAMEASAVLRSLDLLPAAWHLRRSLRSPASGRDKWPSLVPHAAVPRFGPICKHLSWTAHTPLAVNRAATT